MKAAKLTRKARALLNGLAQKNLLHPRQDRNAIERALRAHLRAFVLWRRRFVWMEDARSGVSYIAERASTDTFGAAALINVERVGFLIRALLAILCLALAAFAAVAPLGLFLSWLAGDRTGMALRERFGPTSAINVILIVLLLATLYTSAMLPEALSKTSPVLLNKMSPSA